MARDSWGQGESIGNNKGPALDKFRSLDGTGKGTGSSGSWCACFVSYCLMAACFRIGIALPFPTSRGAKRLTKNALKHGVEVTCIGDDLPQAGDLICWNRGQNKRTAWQGHIGIVARAKSGTPDCYQELSSSTTLHVVEGNKGKYPSVVQEFEYPDDEWRNRLYKVVRL